jgi:hypothetical protein
MLLRPPVPAQVRARKEGVVSKATISGALWGTDQVAQAPDRSTMLIKLICGIPEQVGENPPLEMWKCFISKCIQLLSSPDSLDLNFNHWLSCDVANENSLWKHTSKGVVSQISHCLLLTTETNWWLQERYVFLSLKGDRAQLPQYEMVSEEPNAWRRLLGVSGIMGWPSWKRRPVTPPHVLPRLGGPAISEWTRMVSTYWKQ